MADVARVGPLATERLRLAERTRTRSGPCHDPLDPSADDLEDVKPDSHLIRHLDRQPNGP